MPKSSKLPTTVDQTVRRAYRHTVPTDEAVMRVYLYTLATVASGEGRFTAREFDLVELRDLLTKLFPREIALLNGSIGQPL